MATLTLKIIPFGVQKSPLNSWKVVHILKKIGIRCKILKKKIIGSFFFETTMNAACYPEIIQGFTMNLDAEDGFCWFQQDDATVHTAAPTMYFLKEFFDTRIILKNLQPPRSPDLSPCDSFSGGPM